MTEKIVRFVRHPLVIIALSLLAAYMVVEVSDIPARYKDFDAWLLSFVVTFKLGAALFMFVRTRWRDWTILGAGLCAGFIAIGTLYLATVIVYYTGSFPYLENVISLVRSMLLVSGIFIITGMTQEWWMDNGYSYTHVKYLFGSPFRYILHLARKGLRTIRRTRHGNEEI
jgi:hypothetical protein